MPETEHDDPLLTMREVAARLRVDVATVRRWALCGILPYIQLPRRGHRRIFRFRQSTLDAILERQTP